MLFRNVCNHPQVCTVSQHGTPQSDCVGVVLHAMPEGTAGTFWNINVVTYDIQCVGTQFCYHGADNRAVFAKMLRRLTQTCDVFYLGKHLSCESPRQWF
jgi:hypothetical protein